MKKILLIILDGFGVRDYENANTIKMASLPVLNNLMSSFPVAELEASGESVGLLDTTVGNCEAGHMTIGAGRVILQPLKIIDEKIKDKSFFENESLLSLVDYVNNNQSALHIIGLISSSNIYSSIDHFYAITALAKIKKVKNVIFHFITDGRDSNNMSCKDIINSFMNKISNFEIGQVGTIMGRYYAMDNDNNYDRIKKAYDAIIYNLGNNFNDLDRCFDLHYKNGITDEYINPSIINRNTSIKDNDGVIFMNFTAEGSNELLSSLTDETFKMFNTKNLKNVRYITLFNINSSIESAFTSEPIYNTFGEYLASLDFKQARIAEAEKYSHVTYYFDGAEEFKNKNMYKILVPSAKVPRYDMKPEMSAIEITQSIMAAMGEDIDFILANYANPDTLAHTGNIPATIKALEVCDFCIGKVLEKAEENFYDVVITSDHGNCEYMKDSEGKIMPGHTTNKVPFIIANSKYKIKNEGTLCDVIPTVIDMFGISKPEEMTGQSLLIKD